MKSPTVLLEGLLTKLVIDAYKGREVATFVVPGEYLDVYMSKYKIFLLELRRKFLGVMCKINIDHKKNVRY